MSTARALSVVVVVPWSCVLLLALSAPQLPPLPAVATPMLFTAQPSCTGPNDPSPGCPHDPAPWICTHTGGHGAHQCSCETICGTDEDGNPTVSENQRCARYCKQDKCLCDIEPECKGGER